MYQLLLSGIGYVPTPNVHLDVWNHVESYTIYMFLACRLKITFNFSLKLIISFLVQLQHLLSPSLIVTSSQVIVGMLFLFDCVVSLAWSRWAYYMALLPSMAMALLPPIHLGMSIIMGGQVFQGMGGILVSP